MNSATDSRLKLVHPELAMRVRLIIAELAKNGFQVEVVQGLRTFAEQDKLFNQPHDGIDNNGNGKVDERAECVTRARGGQSNHNYGLAVDLCPFKNGKPDWNDVPAFEAIGIVAKKHGLEWGGDWHSIPDRPHVQLSKLSIAQCQQLYKKGGLPLVWSNAGNPFLA